METILYNISQVLGIAIIHSLWQGLVIYILLRTVFAAIPALPAVKKYNVAVVAILSVAVWFIYTLVSGVLAYNWVKVKPAAISPLLPYLNLKVKTNYQSEFYKAIAQYLPYIGALYFAGLLIQLGRLGWEWRKIRRIKQSLIPAGQMQQYINTFSKKLHITKHIQLKFSELIDVPCMIGYFKPIILLPVSIVTSLSACEVESILLHELSHIKRNDYLVNLLQQVITVMLFFNPFTQLINRIINLERENGCDDLVVEKTGKPLIYARALLKLEETRKVNLQLAMAAAGNKFHLLKRIERIMNTQKQIGNMRHLVVAILLLAGSISCIAWFNPTIAAAKVIKKEFKPLVSFNNQVELNSAITILPMVASYPIPVIMFGDTNRYSILTDTAKNKRKTRNNDSTQNVQDTSQNFREIWDDNDTLKKHHRSAEWRENTARLRMQNQEMRKKFNSPEWKAQMDAIRQQSEELHKKFDSPEWKAQMLAMRKQGEEMRKKFDSPEWKAQMENIRKQGDEMRKKFDSPEWKAQMENMRKQGDEMRKKFDSPEWKAQMENIRKQGEEMRKKFDSPEWKAQMENMRKQGEEMRKKFDSPEWKEQLENMRKQGEEMRKKFDSPEWKEQMENMRRQFDGAEWKDSLKQQKCNLKDSVAKAKKNNYKKTVKKKTD